MPERPIPVATLTNMWVYSCSLAGTMGSNPTGGMHVCLLRVLCLFRHWSLRWAADSSRGVLPSVVCLMWGLHEATLHTTCKQAQLPASTCKQVGSKLSMSVRCWNEKAGQTASSDLVIIWHLRDELKNFCVLSQGTYQLHCVSLLVG
jgi:hypothetical protein